MDEPVLVLRHAAANRWASRLAVATFLVGAYTLREEPAVALALVAGALLATIVHVEILVFRCRADAEGLRLTSVFGRRTWPWSELRGVLVQLDGLRPRVAPPSDTLSSLLLYGPSGQWTLSRSLEGWLPLARELQRRGLLEGELPAQAYGWMRRVRRVLHGTQVVLSLLALVAVTGTFAWWSTVETGWLVAAGRPLGSAALVEGLLLAAVLGATTLAAARLRRKVFADIGAWALRSSGMIGGALLPVVALRLGQTGEAQPAAAALLAVSGVAISVATWWWRGLLS